MDPAGVFLWIAAAVSKPVLEVRANPRIAIALSQCAEVLVTAELKGPQTEALYCPGVEFSIADGARSFQESDCPPYTEREFFPHIWSKRVCLWPHPYGLPWTVTVRLTRADRTLLKGDVDITVR